VLEEGKDTARTESEERQKKRVEYFGQKVAALISLDGRPESVFCCVTCVGRFFPFALAAERGQRKCPSSGKHLHLQKKGGRMA
jgi:hypothetical protein